MEIYFDNKHKIRVKCGEGSMINSTVMIFFASIVYIAFLIRNFVRKKTFTDHFIFTVFYFYVVGVIVVTLFPIPFDKRLIADRLNYSGQLSHNIIPFYSIYQMMSNTPLYVSLRQIGGNILLLFPLGFYISIVKYKYLKFHHSILIGAICATVIEITQMVISTIIGYNYRTADVDDLILNTIGCMLGYLSFKILSPLLSEYRYFNDEIQQRANTK